MTMGETDSAQMLLRLRNLHTAVLCDVLDQMQAPVVFLGPAIRALQPGARLAGRAMTLRTEPVHRPLLPPYQQLLQAFRVISPGAVVIVAGGQEASAGLWGGLLSTAAHARGAAGAVVDGLTRDVDEIRGLGFPVFARGASPLDSAGRHEVVGTQCEVEVHGGLVSPGDYVLGDSMGVIAFPEQAASEAIRLAELKSVGESTVRGELELGTDVQDVFDRYGIL